MGKHKRLVGYRSMAGFTQKDIAALIGVTSKTYSRKESGKADFTAVEMKKIYDVLVEALKQDVEGLQITDIFF